MSRIKKIEISGIDYVVVVENDAEKEKTLVDRGLYAIRRGDHIGRFITIMPENDQISDNTLSVLFFPECEPDYISKKDISSGIKDGTLEFVNKLPKDVYATCVGEYYERRKHIRREEDKKTDELDNRREQSDLQDPLCDPTSEEQSTE